MNVCPVVKSELKSYPWCCNETIKTSLQRNSLREQRNSVDSSDDMTTRTHEDIIETRKIEMAAL